MEKVRYKASVSDAVSEREKKNRQVAYEAAAESIVLLRTTACCRSSRGRWPSTAAGRP